MKINIKLPMLKLSLLLILITCTVRDSIGQKQRYIDINNKFLLPLDSSTVLLPEEKFHVRFRVLNQGPDTLFSEDTMVYEIKASKLFNKLPSREYIKLDRKIAPGDSIIINRYYDLIYYKNYSYIKPFKIFWVVPPLFKRHPNAPKGSINLHWEEIKELDADNHDTLTINFKKRTIGISEVGEAPTGLYPNPLQGNQLHVYTSSNMPLDIRIFNTLGQVVKTYKNQLPHKPINVQYLNSGHYIIELTDKNGNTFMHKLQRI